MNKIIISANSLSKTYQEGRFNTQVLKNINLDIHQGETLAIVGSSGCGKSTLMHLLGGLDQPSSGEVKLMGQNFSLLSPNQRANLRNKYLGFVYQFHHLLPELTALENIALPCFLRKNKNKTKQIKKSEILEKAHLLLSQVGLENRADHKPSELSGGERQRVAIARALVTEPACILADEPTGNLDYQRANEVFELLMSMNKLHKTAIVIVTHDLRLADKLGRKILLTPTL